MIEDAINQLNGALSLPVAPPPRAPYSNRTCSECVHWHKEMSTVFQQPIAGTVAGRCRRYPFAFVHGREMTIFTGYPETAGNFEACSGFEEYKENEPTTI
jgi:hypothetical protein